MIEFLSTWAKSLGLTIIVISILEMLLPNNKTKKYVRMIFGVYILFTMISPFIKNKEILDVSTYDLNAYIDSNTNNQIGKNETSMDNRIEEIYIEELEKDITQKIEDLGYQMITCNVYATLSSKNDENYIEKIELTVEKKQESTENSEQEQQSMEDKLVEEIQKIKPINTTIGDRNRNEEENNTKQNLNNQDIQKIKKFLKEEYGVEEKCLKIN